MWRSTTSHGGFSVHRRLTSSTFYFPRSEKLDVEDHYIAWRQMHEQAALAHGNAADGPFSFCSYPWLLNPRAKSRLLHTEARFVMAQTVQQVWPRVQLCLAVQPRTCMSVRPLSMVIWSDNKVAWLQHLPTVVGMHHVIKPHVLHVQANA